MVLSRLLFAAGSWCLLSAFVLISGADRAHLDASPEAPTVTFVVNEVSPRFNDQAEFLAGKYAELGQQEFWLALIREAMLPWNDIQGSYLRLDLSSAADATPADDDGVHTISLAELNLSAAASAAPRVEGGLINDCDISVSKNPSSAAATAYTMMHELGHCLGLGHNHISYDAVMGYSRTDRNLSLSADDMAGAAFLYPVTGARESRETLGCGQVRGGRSASWLSLVLLALPLFGLCWRHTFADARELKAREIDA